MKFFIDSANLDDLREATSYGVVDGVTTNPSLIAKEGHDHHEQIRAICEIIDGDISAEVVSTDAEGMIREGQTLGVARDPAKPVAGTSASLSPGSEHRFVDIRHHDLAAAGREEPSGHVAGTAGEIEQPSLAPGPQPVDQGPLPNSVGAERHRVVHKIVTRGDGIEDAAHQAGLLRGRDLGEAERDRVPRVVFAVPHVVAQNSRTSVSSRPPAA